MNSVGVRPLEVFSLRAWLCVDEHVKVSAELVVVVALNGGFLDCAVHVLYLAAGPRVVRLGQAVLDLVCVADACRSGFSACRWCCETTFIGAPWDACIR